MRIYKREIVSTLFCKKYKLCIYGYIIICKKFSNLGMESTE